MLTFYILNSIIKLLKGIIIIYINTKENISALMYRDGHDFDFKIKIMILKSKSWFDFDFKSSYI